MLYPTAENPLHDNPVNATYSGGFFYCDSSPPELGPDYYWRDVLTFNRGFRTLNDEATGQ